MFIARGLPLSVTGLEQGVSSAAPPLLHAQIQPQTTGRAQTYWKSGAPRGYTSSEVSVWRKTPDHFDAIKVGLTATPELPRCSADTVES